MQIGSGYSRAVKDRGDVTVRDGRPPQDTHWMGRGGGGLDECSCFCKKVSYYLIGYGG